MRVDGGRMPRRILEWKPMGRRIRGRPRKRWIEDVEDDIQTMGISGWRKLSKERTEWKKSPRRLKHIVGCNTNIRRRMIQACNSATYFSSKLPSSERHNTKAHKTNTFSSHVRCVCNRNYTAEAWVSPNPVLVGILWRKWRRDGFLSKYPNRSAFSYQYIFFYQWSTLIRH